MSSFTSESASLCLSDLCRTVQAWIDTYNTAKAAGKIPSFAPSKQNTGSDPYYADGVDAGANGTCSWTGESR